MNVCRLRMLVTGYSTTQPLLTTLFLRIIIKNIKLAKNNTCIVDHAAQCAETQQNYFLIAVK